MTLFIVTSNSVYIRHINKILFQVSDKFRGVSTSVSNTNDGDPNTTVTGFRCEVTLGYLYNSSLEEDISNSNIQGK